MGELKVTEGAPGASMQRLFHPLNGLYKGSPCVASIAAPSEILLRTISAIETPPPSLNLNFSTPFPTRS